MGSKISGDSVVIFMNVEVLVGFNGVGVGYGDNYFDVIIRYDDFR